MPARDGVRHLAADFGSRGHTISSLCERTAASCPLDDSVLVPFTWYRGGDGWDIPAVPLMEHSVVHLGNNPHSLPLLIAARNWPGNVVVVLHDLWLLDLLTALSRYEGDPGHVLRVLHRELGLDGIRLTRLERAGEDVGHDARVRIAACVCRELLTDNMRIVHHRRSLFAEDVLLRVPALSTTHVALPLQYSSRPSQPPVRPHTWDVVISGFASFGKRLRTLEAAIRALAATRPIRVALVGGVASQFADPAVSTGTSIDRFASAPDPEWEDIHRRARVGVRLGVGSLGEGSGSLRDCLEFGLTVVTDDDEEPIRSHPQVIRVSTTATPDEIVAALVQALEAPEIAPLASSRDDLRRYRDSVAALAVTERLQPSPDHATAPPHPGTD